LFDHLNQLQVRKQKNCVLQFRSVGNRPIVLIELVIGSSRVGDGVHIQSHTASTHARVWPGGRQHKTYIYHMHNISSDRDPQGEKSAAASALRACVFVDVTQLCKKHEVSLDGLQIMALL
jgi:hypothetical protein